MKGFQDALLPLDIQLDVVETLRHSRFIIHVLTLDIRHHLTLKQSIEKLVKKQDYLLKYFCQ